MGLMDKFMGRPPATPEQLAHKQHDHEVKAVQKGLDKSQKHRRLAVLKLGKHLLKLYDDSVETPDGVIFLTPDLTATVETAGSLMTSKRVTLTRLATLGVGAFVFQKKHKDDSRELYVVIDGLTKGSVITCAPDEGEKARKFVIQVNLAAKRSVTVQEQRQAAKTTAQDALSALDA